jgi:tetratricopeptide (TPR) repeat protein
MRPSSWRLAAFLALACVPLSLTPVLAGAADSKPVAKEASDKFASALTPEILYQLLLADIAIQRGEYRLAAKAYLEAAKTTREARLARRATEVSMYAKQPMLGLEAARLWAELEPESVRAKQFVAGLLVTENEITEAKTYIAKLLADEANDKERLAEGLLQLNRLLASQKDKVAVFDLVRELVAPYAKLPEAHFAIAQAGLNSGLTEARIKEASLTEIDAALASRPEWEQAVVLRAQVLGRDDPAKGIEALRAYLADHPKARAARASLAQSLVDLKRLPEAREQLVILAKEDPRPEMQLAIARISLQMNDYDHAEAVLQKLADNPSADPDVARLYLGQISEERKRYDQALERYRSVEDGDQWWTAQLRIAYVLTKLGKLDEARDSLHKLEVENDAQRIQIIQTEAQLLREAGRYKESYELLEQALTKYQDSVDLMYDLAMAAEKIDKLEVLEKQLKQLIAIKPDNAQAYNALGYTLVDRTKRSEEGLHYIEKAYSISPEDPFILDSMGWALYRTGKLDQSVDYLRRALAERADAEIAAHLGEVLWAKGERTEAQHVWQIQLRETPDNEVLRDTMRRFLP